jgi:hypothetical protein
MQLKSLVAGGLLTLIVAYLTLALFSPRRAVLQQSITVDREVAYCFEFCRNWKTMSRWNALLPDSLFEHPDIQVDSSKNGQLLWAYPRAALEGSVRTDSVFENREIRWEFLLQKEGESRKYQTALLFEPLKKETRITWQFQGEERPFLLHPLNLFYGEAFKRRFEQGLIKLKELLEI